MNVEFIPIDQYCLLTNFKHDVEDFSMSLMHAYMSAEQCQWMITFEDGSEELFTKMNCIVLTVSLQ